MEKPGFATEEQFKFLDKKYCMGIDLGYSVEVSAAPCSKFLGDFLDEFPELIIEEGRRVVYYWKQEMTSRPRVKEALSRIRSVAPWDEFPGG